MLKFDSVLFYCRLNFKQKTIMCVYAQIRINTTYVLL